MQSRCRIKRRKSLCARLRPKKRSLGSLILATRLKSAITWRRCKRPVWTVLVTVVAMGVLPVRLSLFKLFFSSCFCSLCRVDRKPEDGGHNNQGGMTDRGGPMSPGSGPSSPFGKDSPTGSNQNTTLALQLQLLQTKTQSSLNNLYTTISPRKGEQIIKSPRGNFTNINTIETLVDSEAFKRALAKQHSSKTLQDFINVLPEKVRVRIRRLC